MPSKYIKKAKRRENGEKAKEESGKKTAHVEGFAYDQEDVLL